MNPTSYKYAIKDCDVTDKPALERFRAKRSEWLDWLRHDEHHAITLSICSLVWNDVSFRVLARAGETNEEGALGNSLIAEALIEGHIAIQTLAIRRLMDDRKSGVISLANLLKDIDRNVGLFTRENFVAFDGLPYDCETARKRVVTAQLVAGNSTFWAARHGPDAYSPSQQAHETFDRISGVDPANRQRLDRIPTRHVKTLRRWLTETNAGSIVDWTDNFLAHAAGRHRRHRVDLAAIQPTLDKITAVTRTFARVSEVVLAYLLFDGGLGNVMPVAQYDELEQLDRPAITAKQASDLTKRWNVMENERNEFAAGVLEEILAVPS
ncbi:MAG TPA: hypothetical protein VIJ63_22290 [Roseiarcus sp.]